MKKIRFGQAVFNVSYLWFPSEVNTLRSTKYDCFYNDDKVDIFLLELEKLLN